jgi:DNA polymerase I-like protein with 3'-5' exonuclease and polymerase domains
MKYIYENSDAYKGLAVQVFNDEGMRKKAKILFLSYTYGMSLENIISSVKELNGNARSARDYFSGFTVFEAWKESIHQEFMANGRVSTISANYLNRSTDEELAEKEKRTSVNHVIQGTATYIFKRALLELSKLNGVQILIPMHDAVVFQHAEYVDPNLAVKIFEDVMTNELGKKIIGKASIEEFYAEND